MFTGFRPECCLIANNHLHLPNSKKCTSMSGLIIRDRPADSNCVEPNVLFAQQISIICCIDGHLIWIRARKRQLFLIKKGYKSSSSLLCKCNKLCMRERSSITHSAWQHARCVWERSGWAKSCQSSVNTGLRGDDAKACLTWLPRPCIQTAGKNI